MRFRSVVFLDGDNADEALRILDRDGDDSLFEYLMQWEYGEPSEESDREPWGQSDWTTTHRCGDSAYVVSHNWNLSYVSLTEVVYDD